jgi:hypothetical protein
MWEESVFKLARFKVHKVVSLTTGVLCSALLGNWFLKFCWIVVTSPFKGNYGLIIILKKKILGTSCPMTRHHIPEIAYSSFFLTCLWCRWENNFVVYEGVGHRHGLNRQTVDFDVTYIM